MEARARRRVGIREAVTLSGEDIERIDALASLDGHSLALLDALPPGQREAVRAHGARLALLPRHRRRLQLSELAIRKRVSRGLSTLKRQLEEPT